MRATCASPAATSLAVVLTELLQNVMDHAYPPGTLGGSETAGNVRMALSQQPPGSVQIVVRDDGVGVARRDFDPGSGDEPGPVDRARPRGRLDGTIEFGSGRWIRSDGAGTRRSTSGSRWRPEPQAAPDAKTASRIGRSVDPSADP